MFITRFSLIFSSMTTESNLHKLRSVDVDTDIEVLVGLLVLLVLLHLVYGKSSHPIFVRFEEAEVEKAFVETLTLMGFDPVNRDDVKNIELDPKSTRILRVTRPNHRVARKIDSPEFGDTRY